MLKESITVDETINFLNNLLKIDRGAIESLIKGRFLCGEELANHESVQVLKEDGNYLVGFLGILNGLFGISETGYGVISANYDLICANGHKGKDIDRTAVGDVCPICGSKILLGDLVSFEYT